MNKCEKNHKELNQTTNIITPDCKF